ncbi:MAG: F0F1 ATP synthase subunit epsilon [Defluviitaleaceae bacterium]|nr:F0F1 ATP synthase subunit epsilon [Defluviitaleaceae bacterium]
MKKKLRLRIITQERIALDTTADMLIVRCQTGDWGLMPGHETMSSVLAANSLLRVLVDGEAEQTVKIYGGLAQIANDVVTILTNNAEI